MNNAKIIWKYFQIIKYTVAKIWHLRLCLTSVATSSLTSWVIIIKYTTTVFNYLVKEDRSAFRKLVYIIAILNEQK